MSTTAAQLRAARALLGLSQSQVSDESGVSIPTIKRIESDQLGPSNSTVGNVERIAQVYVSHGVELLFDEGGKGIGARLIGTGDGETPQTT